MIGHCLETSRKSVGKSETRLESMVGRLSREVVQSLSWSLEISWGILGRLPGRTLDKNRAKVCLGDNLKRLLWEIVRNQARGLAAETLQGSGPGPGSRAPGSLQAWGLAPGLPHAWGLARTPPQGTWAWRQGTPGGVEEPN